MSRTVYCLDTIVLVKTLVPEDGSDDASRLLHNVIATGSILVAPPFAWAETGTILRKKIKAGLSLCPFTSLPVPKFRRPSKR